MAFFGYSNNLGLVEEEKNTGAFGLSDMHTDSKRADEEAHF